MSGNKLLKENTIRRFMKLANVGPLSDNFISEMGMKNPGEEEDDLEEGVYKEEDEETLEEQEEEEEMDLDMGEEEPLADDDIEMVDDEAPSELGSADISLTEEEAQLLIDLGERLGAAMEADPEEELDMPDDEADLELDDLGPPEDAPEEMGEEEREEIMQEVLKRVTKRLLSSRRK